MDRGTAWRSTSRPPNPSAAQPVAMPAHHRSGLDEHQRRAPVAPAVCQGDPKQSVAWLQRRSLLSTLHRYQLLAEGHILEDQFPMAAAHQRQAADNHNEQLQHGAIVAGIGAQYNSDAFWRGTVTSSAMSVSRSFRLGLK